MADQLVSVDHGLGGADDKRGTDALPSRPHSGAVLVRNGWGGDPASRQRFRGAYCGMLFWPILLLGCAGYQVGTSTLYDPHVRTVYVPMFESDSYRRNLGERLTEAVMKEIEDTTSYKVVGTPGADSTLRGRITGDTKRVVVENYYDDPRELEVGLHVEVEWFDRHGSPIRPRRSIPFTPEVVAVSGTAPLFPEIGQSVATAHQQAIQRVAEQIVGMMENPW